MNVRPAARRAGFRALLLIVGCVLVIIGLLTLALKIAGAMFQLLLWLGVILIAVWAVAIVLRRLKR